MQMTVEVQVEFEDGRRELWFVFVHPHPDWMITNVDGMWAVAKKLRGGFKSLVARTEK
jgi:hypothetical protein